MRHVRWLLTLTALTIVGCAPGRGTLTGKVFLDKTPLKVGTIAVYSENGQYSAMGMITANDGTYLVKNAPAGPVKIAVVVPNPKELMGIPDPNMDPKVRAELAEQARNAVPIPMIYADPEKSNLRTTVEANGESVYDIRLQP